MPLSISSFDQKPMGISLKQTWLICLVVVLSIMVAWEGFWRLRGFVPVIEDDRKLWFLVRSEINESTKVVFIGASRIQLGVHPDMFEQKTGIKPLILAIDGNPPFSVLENLADDPLFKGTLFCSIHPQWLAEPSPKKDRSAKWVKKYIPPTLLSRIELQLSLLMQQTFVFRYPGLSLPKLKKNYRQKRWPQPGYSAIRPDRYREAHFTDENTPRIYDSRVRRVKHFTSNSKALAPQAFMERVLRIESHVKKIESRGGQVIFIRMPSSGEVRKLESKAWPRSRYWDIFAQHVSGATIHFEDHGSLKEFYCPDGSHLGIEDAKKFTNRLLELLETEAQVEFNQNCCC